MDTPSGISPLSRFASFESEGSHCLPIGDVLLLHYPCVSVPLPQRTPSLPHTHEHRCNLGFSSGFNQGSDGDRNQSGCSVLCCSCRGKRATGTKLICWRQSWAECSWMCREEKGMKNEGGAVKQMQDRHTRHGDTAATDTTADVFTSWSVRVNKHGTGQICKIHSLWIHNCEQSSTSGIRFTNPSASSCLNWRYGWK